MHGIRQMTQMDIFYHAINYSSKGVVDVAFGGAFRRKSAKEQLSSLRSWQREIIELYF